MTVEQWKKLAAKAVVPDGDNSNPSPQTLPHSDPEPPIDDVNPFAMGDDSDSAVDAAQELVNPTKPNYLANCKVPKAFAYADMVIEWEKQEGARELAALDNWFITSLKELDCARPGKDNRAKIYAEVMKALRQQEFEKELATGDRLLGGKR